MARKKNEVSEQVIRVDGEIKRRKNVYYEKVSYRYRVFAFLMVLSLALLAGALMIIYGEHITYDNFVYLIRDLDSVKESSGGFTEVSFTADESSVVRPFRDGFVVIGNGEVTLYDKTGVVLCSEKEKLSYPHGASSDKYVLVYDIGGTSYSVYSSVTRVIKKTSEAPIISASVSNNGSYIVTAESGDAKYVTEVYDSSFKRTMSIYKDKYVIDSAIGKEGETFVIASVAEQGAEFFAEVSFYKEGNDSPIKTYTYSMSMPVTVSSYDGGSFSVLFDDCIRFYDENGNVKKENYVSDAKVAFFDARPTGAVLVSSSLGINQGNVFTSFDKDGKEITTARVDGKVTGVFATLNNSTAGYVLTGDGKVLSVSTDGKAVSVATDKNIRSVMDTPSGPVAMTLTKAYLLKGKTE